MNKNKIQELAEQAGLLGPSSRVGKAHEATEKFAALIIAECAKACEPRTWVGLTDEWVTSAGAVGRRDLLVARAIEAKLKELNHD